MKIYTKTGDKGQTSLVGGKRVPKTHVRLDAYGTIDELNSFIGLLIEYVEDEQDLATLTEIQSLLFTVGCNLATEPGKDKTGACTLAADAVDMLEREIDRLDAQLPPLKNFVLPGGGKSAALAHICRTVTRRAERFICKIADDGETDTVILLFVNRLSDYFFVLARKENHLRQKREKKWGNTCK